MKKGFMLSICILLPMLCGAWGGGWSVVGQEQGFQIGAANNANWWGGVGTSESGNTATFAQEQSVFGNGPGGSYGLQKETGIFVQQGTIHNVSGPTFLSQNAAISGGQTQDITRGWNQGVGQGQGMNLALDTSVCKPWGVGTVSAGQGFVGGQQQISIGPGTTGAQSQFVGAAQYVGLMTGPNTDPTVTNSLDIQLGQSQTATGGGYHP